jgi:hypothetical protein
MIEQNSYPPFASAEALAFDYYSFFVKAFDYYSYAVVRLPILCRPRQLIFLTKPERGRIPDKEKWFRKRKSPNQSLIYSKRTTMFSKIHNL